MPSLPIRGDFDHTAVAVRCQPGGNTAVEEPDRRQRLAFRLQEVVLMQRHWYEVRREPLKVSGREQGKQMIATVVAGHESHPDTSVPTRQEAFRIECTG